MSNDSVKKKIDDLRSKIRYHDWRYYVLSDPEISDREYDSMMRELRDIETQHPELVLILPRKEFRVRYQTDSAL